MNRWTHAEDTYLANNFATATMDALTTTLSNRTRDAIYCRAKLLGLSRENRGRIGHGRFLVGTPFRPGSLPKVTNIRDAIIKELVEHTERTKKQLKQATGASDSAIWKACDRLKQQNNIHTSRFQPVENSPGNFESVYRIGSGVDAIKPECTKQDAEPNPHEIQPIPRPVLGAWGLVWNTTPAEGLTT